MKFLLIRKRALLKYALAFVLTLTAVVGVRVTNSAQVWGGTTARAMPIYSVGTNEKVVAVSFDANFGNENTAAILDTLVKHDAKASYFVVGSWAEKYSDDLLRLHESGRVEIGTNSNTYPRMSKLSQRQMELELKTSLAIIESVTGTRPELFRAPYGDYSDQLLSISQRAGLFTIQWDIDSLDNSDLTASQVAAKVINSVQNGSIILMRDDGKNTIAALPAILEGLRNRGYSFKTVGEMIHRENFVIDKTGRQTLRR